MKASGMICVLVLAMGSSAGAQCACSGGAPADAVPVATTAEAPAATPVAAIEAVKTVSEAYPGLASAGLKEARLADLPEGVLLRSGEVTIGAADLAADMTKAPTELQEQLGKNRFFVLEQMGTRQLLLAEARAAAAKDGKDVANLPEHELFKSFLEKLAADVKVSDADVSEFYEKNKEMVGGQPLEAVKEPITGFLRQQKQQEAVGRHIEAMGERRTIEVAAHWVKEQAALAKDNPVDRARTSGKPSLVDFGAKGCVPCDKLAPILEAMEKKYEGRANVVFVSVREEQILASRYGIQSIPVQIFFDADGLEVFRHSGFWPQEELEKKLAEMGVK
jgi:thioredoxin 1